MQPDRLVNGGGYTFEGKSVLYLGLMASGYVFKTGKYKTISLNKQEVEEQITL